MSVRSNSVNLTLFVLSIAVPIVLQSRLELHLCRRVFEIIHLGGRSGVEFFGASEGLHLNVHAASRRVSRDARVSAGTGSNGNRISLVLARRRMRSGARISYFSNERLGKERANVQDLSSLIAEIGEPSYNTASHNLKRY
jgi:hypothetical protein